MVSGHLGECLGRVVECSPCGKGGAALLHGRGGERQYQYDGSRHEAADLETCTLGRLDIYLEFSGSHTGQVLELADFSALGHTFGR